MDAQRKLKEVTIYTDGACEPNPGPGGYGIVMIYGNQRKELSGGCRLSTNNRMELLAAIMALEALKVICQVTLYSDSKYLVEGITEGHVRRWKAHDWWRNKKEKAINVDLWERLLTQCDKHQVKFAWVKGHAGNRNNERCDELSLQITKRTDLPADEGYEQRPKSEPTETAKINQEGQPCRKCSTPVIKKKPRRKPKPNQAYDYEYYLYCPKCHTMYMPDEAKRLLQ